MTSMTWVLIGQWFSLLMFAVAAFFNWQVMRNLAKLRKSLLEWQAALETREAAINARELNDWRRKL